MAVEKVKDHPEIRAHTMRVHRPRVRIALPPRRHDQSGQCAAIQENRKTRFIHVHLDQVPGLFVKPLIFWGALAVLSVLYCLPGHPSAGRFVPWDIALHVGLFAGLGLVLARARETRMRRLIILAVLAAALEIGQWLVGQFRQIEIVDILANEVGVALVALFYWGNRQ